MNEEEKIEELINLLKDSIFRDERFMTLRTDVDNLKIAAAKDEETIIEENIEEEKVEDTTIDEIVEDKKMSNWELMRKKLRGEL